MVGLRKTQSVEDLGGPRFRRVTVDVLQARVQLGDAVAIVRRLGRGKIPLHGAQFDIAVEHKVEGRGRQGRRVLGDMADAPARRQLEVASLGMQFAPQQGEEGGLAAAIGAGQADLPARVQLQARVVDQALAGTGEPEFAQKDHYNGRMEKTRILEAGRKTLRIGCLAFALSVLPAIAQDTAPTGDTDWDALRQEAQQKRDQAKQMRDEARKVEAAKTKACWEKFLVSACQEEAHKELKAVEREADRINVEAGRIERQVKEHDRQERLAKKTADAQLKAEKAAAREQKMREKEEKQREKLEKKQADIDKGATQAQKNQQKEEKQHRKVAKKQEDIAKRESKAAP